MLCLQVLCSLHGKTMQVALVLICNRDWEGWKQTQQVAESGNRPGCTWRSMRLGWWMQNNCSIISNRTQLGLESHSVVKYCNSLPNSSVTIAIGTPLLWLAVLKALQRAWGHSGEFVDCWEGFSKLRRDILTGASGLFLTTLVLHSPCSTWSPHPLNKIIPAWVA